MVSIRKREANRNNAKRSTGPRSSQGKLRVGRNALRHGLSMKPAASPAIERMAKWICGKHASQLQYEEALNIAESQSLVQAVRTARIAAIRRMITVVQTPGKQVADSRAPPAPEIENEVSALEGALPEMIRYDRYERRALSRRKRAIRSFVATSVLGVRPAPAMTESSRPELAFNCTAELAK